MSTHSLQSENAAGRRPRAGAVRRRGFTLIEMSLVVVVVTVLLAVTAGAIAVAVRKSREAAERQLISALAFSAEKFKQEFGQLPPLIDDDNRFNYGGPFDSGTPIAFEYHKINGGNNGAQQYREALEDLNARRYSIYSLGVYLAGVLPKGEPDDPSGDGVEGPGMTAPAVDGTFSKKGRRFEPLFDTSRTPDRLVQDGNDAGERVEIRDRWGSAIRYYRWLPTYHEDGEREGLVQRFNVPGSVGNPESDATLRDATFAIVSPGPDRLVDDLDPDSPVNRDNIVEVGR